MSGFVVEDLHIEEKTLAEDRTSSMLERAEQEMTAACERWVAALEKERKEASRYFVVVTGDLSSSSMPMPEKSIGPGTMEELAALRDEVNERHREWLEAIGRYRRELELS